MTRKNTKRTILNDQSFLREIIALKDKMNTNRKTNYRRHRYMEGFLAQFYAEWEGEK
jgi:uncharacterized protein